MADDGRKRLDWQWEEIVLACDLAHHVEPLQAGGEKPRSIKDLALLCLNCHRMIHAKPPWPTPAELRKLIEQQAFA